MLGNAGYTGADKRPKLLIATYPRPSPGQAVEHCHQARHHQGAPESAAGFGRADRVLDLYALDKVTACVAMIDETSSPIRSGPEPDLDAR